LMPVHPKRFTYALMGMCNWMHRWYRPGGEWTPDTVAEEFIRLLESGYLPQRAENAPEALLDEVRMLRREVEEVKSALSILVRTAAIQPRRSASLGKRTPPSSVAR